MLVSAVTLGCALLLGQAEAPAEAPVEANAVLSPEPPRTPGPWDFQMALPDAASPQQPNEGQALCLALPPTPAVPSGEWRARCDDAKKECLVSPARELDSEGHENDQPLQRVDRCLP
ncbi:MAG: hypothetical protein EOO71_43085, partial [Myxococcaceae bacterium]